MNYQGRWTFVRTVEVKSQKRIQYPDIAESYISKPTHRGPKVYWYLNNLADLVILSDTKGLDDPNLVKMGYCKAPNSSGYATPPQQIRDNIGERFKEGNVLVIGTLESMIKEDVSKAFLFSESQFLNAISN